LAVSSLLPTFETSSDTSSHKKAYDLGL